MSVNMGDEGGVTDAPPHAAAEPREGLRRELTKIEDQLLRIVFEPFYGENGQWPTWDYASRKIYRDTGKAAWPIWQGLPTVNVLDAYGQLSSYGLLWRSTRDAYEPSPDSRIGLTIPGLLAISVESTAAREFIDWAIEVGRQCAQYEIDAPLDPGKSNSTYIETSLWHDSLYHFTGLPGGIRPAHAWEVFRHEPLMPAVIERQSNHDGEGVAWDLRVLPRNRQLVLMEGPDHYLDMVEAEAHTQESGPQPVAPIELVRAFDFFAMAVALAPILKWSHVLVPRRLLPITRLVEPVQTSEELSDRLSALANILSDLEIPQIPASHWHESLPPRSLTRLRYWLVTKHRLAVEEEIKALIAINRVRVHFQHPNSDGEIRKHYQRLGLEMPIINWGRSWEIVVAHATRALQTIADSILDYDPEELESEPQ